MNKFVLIIGCERSGTTFLVETLVRFYDFPKMIETPWMISYWKKYRHQVFSTVEKQERLLKKIFSRISYKKTEAFHKIKFNPKNFLQEGNFDLKRFLHQHHTYLSQVQGKSWCLNKTCQFAKEMEIVDEIFDDPRFLYIIRDGRDVALSLLKVHGWGPSTVYKAAYWWKNSVEKFSHYAQEIPSQRYLKIFYEQLIQDPVKHFKEISEFFSFTDPICQERLEAEIEIKKENREKWRIEWSSSQIRLFERIAGEALKQNGYSLTDEKHLNDKLSWREHLWYQVQEVYLCLFRRDRLFFRLFSKIDPLLYKIPFLHKKFVSYLLKKRKHVSS
jgi:hypothetical protein